MVEIIFFFFLLFLRFRNDDEVTITMEIHCAQKNLPTRNINSTFSNSEHMCVWFSFFLSFFLSK